MRKLATGILALSIIFLSDQVCAQQLQYDIIWIGKIGKLNINKTQIDAYSYIETNSEVKLPFYKLNWITSTKVLDGQLKISNYAQLLNNKTREFTEIENINDSTWQKENDIGEKELIHIKHQFNVSDLYFEEPLNQRYIFSERFGIPVELVELGDGHYRLLLPEDNFCDYFYEQGICTNVKVKNGNRTFRFVLSEDG